MILLTLSVVQVQAIPALVSGQSSGVCGRSHPARNKEGFFIHKRKEGCTVLCN